MIGFEILTGFTPDGTPLTRPLTPAESAALGNAVNA